MAASSNAPLYSRFLGCLLGSAVGDAIGAPWEGLTSFDIHQLAGPALEKVFHPDADELDYTDDTEMMVGVAEALAKHGSIQSESLIQIFARNYHPERGYGKGARRILEAVIAGEDWDHVASSTFPGGSLGNGAAMRVAPIGIFFCDDLDHVWSEARESAWPTHRHPVGIEAAQVLALAIALAARATSLSRKQFLDALLERAHTEEIRWALQTARSLHRGDSIGVLGSTLEAHRSVVTAIASFAASPGDFETAVGRVIALGDDTDTLAAMTGALCGAFAGIDAIPARLVAKLENTPSGRNHIRSLAERLFQLFHRRTNRDENLEAESPG